MRSARSGNRSVWALAFTSPCQPVHRGRNPVRGDPCPGRGGPDHRGHAALKHGNAHGAHAVRSHRPQHRNEELGVDGTRQTIRLAPRTCPRDGPAPAASCRTRGTSSWWAVRFEPRSSPIVLATTLTDGSGAFSMAGRVRAGATSAGRIRSSRRRRRSRCGAVPDDDGGGHGRPGVRRESVRRRGCRCPGGHGRPGRLHRTPRTTPHRRCRCVAPHRSAPSSRTWLETVLRAPHSGMPSASVANFQCPASAWNRSTRSERIRPRSDTSMPLERAHSRMARFCSRSARADRTGRTRPP